jgi:hypothetical protein
MNVGTNPADELKYYTRRSNDLHAEYSADPLLRDSYPQFINWQLKYLLTYFEDMQRNADQAAAVAFVVSDLAGVEIMQRDRDFARVLPLMIRMLPDGVLAGAAAAMKLNASVLEINIAICRNLVNAGWDGTELSEYDYGGACRKAASYTDCMTLVELTTSLGRQLQQVIQMPLIGITLKAMRHPSRMTGFGALQNFLETGYRRFAALDDVDRFLIDIESHMKHIFTRVYKAPLKQLSA